MPENSTLGDSIQLVKGRVPKATATNSVLLPYLTPEYLRGGATIPNLFPATDKTVQVKDGEINILRDGSNAGEVFSAREGIVSSTMAVVKYDQRTIQPSFLFHYLKFYEPYLKAQTAGSGIPHLDKELLGLLPAIEQSEGQQIRIAAILTNLDQLITTTEALIAKQQRLRTGLLHDLLTRGLDQHGQLRSEETHEFKDSPLGRIPVEWNAEVLSEHVDVYGGKRLPSGHSYAEGATKYRYLRVLDFYKKNVVASQLESLEEPTYQTLVRYKIDPGDLFISIAGSIGFVGVVRISENECKLILTENAARLKLLSDIDADFLALVMNGGQLQSQIGEAIGTGGGVPKLAIFRIKTLVIPVPKSDEQKKIVETIDCMDRQQRFAAARLAKLRRLKTGLMQDLLTGRIPVGELDSILSEA